MAETSDAAFVERFDLAGYDRDSGTLRIGPRAALESGATADEAEEVALTALGDAKRANRQYHKVLLTSAEARLLREGTWESRGICSRRLVRAPLLCMPVIALLAAAALFRTGSAAVARVLLLGGMGMSLLFIVPFLRSIRQRAVALSAM